MLHLSVLVVCSLCCSLSVWWVQCAPEIQVWVSAGCRAVASRREYLSTCFCPSPSYEATVSCF